MNPVRTFSLLAVLALLAFGGLTSTAVPPGTGPATQAAFSVRAEEAPESIAAASAPSNPVEVDPAVAAQSREAKRLLTDLAATYEHLDGVTVVLGETPKDEQAVAYYTDGEIVISPNHEASIDEILAHEIWHVIDWRDNGRIDWGEDLPPSNSSDYLSK